MTEIERALLDIAEVRERLGAAQKFKGYSGIAAIASGAFALVAGIAQALLITNPVAEPSRWFAIWLVCCALSIFVNYGAIAHWFVSDVSVRDRWQTRTVGLAILPALIVGAALSFALLDAHQAALMPGVWCACYGVGLFASRTMVPRGVVIIAAGYLIAGIGLFFAGGDAMEWWVTASAFALGQSAIGILLLRDRAQGGAA